MTDVITVLGSHGALRVDRLSGHILTVESCDCDDCERLGDYRSIALFDPARWDECALRYGQTDILTTAFVDKLGRYQRECTVIETGDPACLDYYLDEVLFLPAPSIEDAPEALRLFDCIYCDAPAGAPHAESCEMVSHAHG